MDTATTPKAKEAPTTQHPQQVAVLFQTTPLILESGLQLRRVRVAYHSYGVPQAQATLVLHALTGDSALHRWWLTLFGSGQALDPEREFLICSNVLGGCAGSSSMQELNLEPEQLSLNDIVRVQRELLRALGVQQVTLVGGSMGGMQVYAWLATFPELVQRAVVVAAPARHSPWAVGLNTVARNAILSAPGGAGLEVARQLAILSYRSPQGLLHTQSGPSSQQPWRPAVSTYLEHQGKKLTQRFCEKSYLALTYAMDRFALSDEELGNISVPVLVVGISSDQLYPAWEVREYAERLGNAMYWELDSPHGHDAFLMDAEALNERLKLFLRE